MTELLSFFIVLFAIIAFLATLLSILLYSQKPQLLYDLSYTQLRTKKIQYKKQSPRSLVLYDCISFVFGWTTTLIAVIVLLPVLLIHMLLLFSCHIKPIITYRTIVGKGQKPIRLYRFNTPSTQELPKSPIVQLLITLDKASVTELPVLFNMLRGDITLFGLTKINYNKLPTISEHNEPLLQQYNQHRPGLISLSVLNSDVLSACATDLEKYEIIAFLNSVFIARRSMFMLLNVLKTVTLLCFRPSK